MEYEKDGVVEEFCMSDGFLTVGHRKVLSEPIPKNGLSYDFQARTPRQRNVSKLVELVPIASPLDDIVNSCG